MKAILNKVFDYIFPEGCAGCGCKGKIVCAECEKEIHSAETVTGKSGMLQRTGADGVYFTYKYGNKKLTKLLFALKQKNNQAIAEYFASKIHKSLNNSIKYDIITNAPRSGNNTNLYGYDHAEVLARSLSAASDVPYKKCFAQKAAGADQKTLTFEERKKNSEGKYKITAKEIPRSVLIIDDVCTSGETLAECINMLRKSGAETVIAAVIANRM